MLPLILAALLLAEASKLADSSPLWQNETASQDAEIIKVVNYMDSNPETLEELVTKNVVMEGDIVLPSDRNAVRSIWPSHVIPYVISPDSVGQRANILAAMAMLSQHTCVSFPKRTSETDYLHFVDGKGCASYVGFSGGEQPIFIGPRCIVGNIVHEILHALGFHHEHTRMDRDQYIKVLTDNIVEGKVRNFEKQQGSTLDLGYDVKSILHYGSEFFSANGLPTIVANEDEDEMGQRVRLTETDIKRLSLLYNCGGKKTAHDANPLVLFHDVKNHTSSAHRREEDQTAAPSSSSVMLNATTRGQNNTSGEKDTWNY